MWREEAWAPALPWSAASSLRAMWAYLRKEWRLEMSYRFSYLWGVFGLYTTIATFFFLDRLFEQRITADLAPFGVSFFAYALVGNAFFAYVGTTLRGVSGRVSQEQGIGTLEMLVATPTPLWLLLLGAALWSVVTATAQMLVYLTVGSLGFGVDLSRLHWGSLAATLSLVIVAFTGIGLLEASWILAFKRGSLVAWALNGVWALLGGVMFPVTVLPDWLQSIARWVPMPHAIHAVQCAIFRHSPPREIAADLWWLLAWCVVLVPTAAWSWRSALAHVRRAGSFTAI